MKAGVVGCKKILGYSLAVICTIMAFFLTYYSTCYSIRQITVPNGVAMLETRDSLALHFLTAAVFLIVILAARRKKQEICREGGCRFALGAVMLCATLCSFIWVASGNFYAMDDSRQVLDCMEHMRNGDYSDLRPNGYLGIYQQHFGLITLFRIIFFLAGTTDDMAVQFFNCLCIPVIIYAGFQVLKELNASRASLIGYFLLAVFCFPLLCYTPYVYGEIISATAGMLFIWAALCYLKRGNISAWPAMAASAVIGNMARGNFPVLLIAFGMVAFLYSVRRKNLKLILFAVSLFLAVVLAGKVNVAYYEKISGIALDQGLPPEATIAMGMDEYGELGYGTYNGFEVQLLAGCGYDTEATRLQARQFIRDRVKMFVTGAGMSAKDFYKGKLLVQWNDPTLNCFMENRNFILPPQHPVRDIVSEEGKYAALARELMNQYQFLLYTGFLLYCLSLLGRGNVSFCQYLPLIIIFGGFLFTLLWEAMSRYVFPYIIYMIPLAATGWDLAGQRIGNIRDVFRGKGK